MSRNRLLLVGFGVLAVVIAPMVLFSGGAVPAHVLAARCEASEPRWNSYQEDIKGQIGARPVAEWQGDLVAAELRDEVLTLDFALEEPWHSLPAAIPVLLRLPDGSVLLPQASREEGGLRRYSYRLDENTATSWVEVQYPHQRDRLIFDSAGQWRR